MSDVDHFFKLSMFLASENEYLQLRLATFLQKALSCTEYHFVWTDVITEAISDQAASFWLWNTHSTIIPIC